MDLDLLLKKMKDAGLSKDDLAIALGVDRATIYRKIAKNGDPFTIKQARQISDILHLNPETASRIFFNR